MPDFQNRRESFKPIEATFQNHLTGHLYRLVPASLIASHDDIYSQVTDICQEQQIHTYLFKEKWGGRAYSLEDARRFLRWAHDGWRNQTHFVFLIVSGCGEVAGAIDVKSSIKESAEIGYWCSNHHRGLMTNAVKSLSALAAHNGYQSLFAKVRLDNPASIAVLERAGFKKDTNWDENPKKACYLLALNRAR